jgi:hypothetical protein
MVTEKRRFQTVSTTGERVTIVEYKHWRTWQPLSGPEQKLPTNTELFTADGRDVTPAEGGAYKIVLTDEILQPVV